MWLVPHLNQLTASMNLKELLADPIFLDLVGDFLSELPEKISRIEKAATESDWATVRTLSHQLKGCGGGYGFREISEIAAEIENLSKENSPELSAVEKSIDLLSASCAKAELQLEDHRSKV